MTSRMCLVGLSAATVQQHCRPPWTNLSPPSSWEVRTIPLDTAGARGLVPGVFGGLSNQKCEYRVVTAAALRVCGEHLTLAHLGLSRPLDHRNLANRCSGVVAKPDLGLNGLFWPYFGPSPYLRGRGPRGVLGCHDGCHLVYGTV